MWLFVQFDQYIEQKITYQCGWGFIMDNTTNPKKSQNPTFFGFNMTLKGFIQNGETYQYDLWLMKNYLIMWVQICHGQHNEQKII